MLHYRRLSRFYFINQLLRLATSPAASWLIRVQQICIMMAFPCLTIQGTKFVARDISSPAFDLRVCHSYAYATLQYSQRTIPQALALSSHPRTLHHDTMILACKTDRNPAMMIQRAKCRSDCTGCTAAAAWHDAVVYWMHSSSCMALCCRIVLCLIKSNRFIPQPAPSMLLLQAELLMTKASRRRYLLESAEFWAMRELVELSKGAFSSLPAWLAAIVQHAADLTTSSLLAQR